MYGLPSDLVDSVGFNLNPDEEGTVLLFPSNYFIFTPAAQSLVKCNRSSVCFKYNINTPLLNVKTICVYIIQETVPRYEEISVTSGALAVIYSSSGSADPSYKVIQYSQYQFMPHSLPLQHYLTQVQAFSIASPDKTRLVTVIFRWQQAFLAGR